MIKLEDRAKTIWGTDPRDYINDGWGFTNVQVERNKAAAQQQPQIDTSNAIGSLAEALGPTPAEREARQQRMERNRQQMQMWGGLFNGLRQLGNLYYTARGARPQRMEDPSGFINQEADRRQRLQDDMDNYRQRYAMQLYNLQRQQVDEARRAKLADAQASWYDTRGEMARLKGENDRLKAEKYVQLQDGRIAKLNAETGKIEALLPLQEDEIRSRTNKNNRMGYGSGGGRGKNNGTYGYTIRKHIDPATGDVVTTRTPTTGNNPNAAPQDKRKGSSGKRGSLLPGGNKNETKTRGSLLP